MKATEQSPTLPDKQTIPDTYITEDEKRNDYLNFIGYVLNTALLKNGGKRKLKAEDGR